MAQVRVEGSQGRKGGQTMQLLTEELRASLPPLRNQRQNKDPHIYAKFFTPASNWTWFVIEGHAEDDDFIFFGHVFGDYEDSELGYFSLKETGKRSRRAAI